MKYIRNAFVLGFLIAGLLPKMASASSSWLEMRGPDVLRSIVVNSWGGVVFQGTANFSDSEDTVISPDLLKIRLGTENNSRSHMCVLFKETCYDLGITPEIGIHLAKWVLTEQTGAYTAGLNSDIEDSEQYLKPVSGGWASSYLAEGEIPEILEFIDFDLLMNSFEDSEIREKYNSRLGSEFDFSHYQGLAPDSYINTDIDMTYTTILSNGRTQSVGSIFRYHWIETGAEYPYITEVQKACSPESVKSYNVEECSGLPLSEYISSDFDSGDVQQGDYISFYLVINSTADSVTENQTTIRKSNPETVFLSIPSSNAETFKDYSWNIEEESEQFNHVRLTATDGILLMEWEDVVGGGDGDFNDLQVSVNNVSESIVKGIFRVDEQLETLSQLHFRLTGKDSANISEFGFFKVDDNNGSIDGLSPDESGYIDAALSRSRRSTVMSYEEMNMIQEEIDFYYPLQQKATMLAQTASIFRRFADDNPEALEAFVKQADLSISSKIP